MVGESPLVLIAGDSSTERAVLAQWPGARIVGVFRDLSLLEYMASGIRPDIVAVDVSIPCRGETLESWVARFRVAHPSTTVSVVDGSPARAHQAAGEAHAPLAVLGSQTIVIWSPKGGVGKTFLSTNLACAASLATGGNAVLLDMDLCSGDVAVHLDLLDGPAITDLIPVLPDLRPEGLDKYARKHAPSGLNVICGPRQPELCDLVTPDVVKSVLSLASKRWGLTYVDTPPDMGSDVVGECVDAATKIVLVTTQDVSSLKQCRAAMDILAKLGIPDSTLAVVVNKASRDSLMPVQKVEEFLGVEIAGTIPEDRKAAERSVFEGRPLALISKHDISEAVWQVLYHLSPGLGRNLPNKKQPRRRGIFW
ncbi:MAG TPA: P-loop NTPase [Firmicutes bacterium]|nr:P-loop NTPase [Candidatus Fermentithermobacillaceae bacterium]